MSDDEDRDVPATEFGWSHSPEAMRAPEFRERLVAERTGSSPRDAWAKLKQRWSGR